MQVICISAKARHGKDTAAELMKEYLESIGKRVLITHYADLVKYVCTNFFGWDGNKDEKGRTLLQYIGTDVVCAQNPSYWVDFIVSILEMFEGEWDFVLIPDCRYPIEAEKVSNKFHTKILRIFRPDFDNGLTDKQKRHPSETCMDTFPFDATIINDSSTAVLRDKLICWLKYEFLENNHR